MYTSYRVRAQYKALRDKAAILGKHLKGRGNNSVQVEPTLSYLYVDYGSFNQRLSSLCHYGYFWVSLPSVGMKSGKTN